MNSNILYAANSVLSLLALMLLLITAYLLMLTVAALIGRRRLERRRHTLTPKLPGRLPHIAILVPAHNEELLLPHLLQSLAKVAYPRDRYTVCVVADNCTDTTARLAREAGALVFERANLQERGKGYALRWLLAQLHGQGRRFDAYLFLDADSVVSANLLMALAGRLASGAQVLQSYYGVLPAGNTVSSQIRTIALLLFNYLRPLGREALGLSAGLKGNGMCFATAIIEQYGWECFSLAEDVEYSLRLALAGIRVAFVPEASVLAQMPANFAQARSQNVRWERGRVEMLRQYGLTLLCSGIRQHRWVPIDAAIEQCIPPLSVPFALSGLAIGLGIMAHNPLSTGEAVAAFLGQVIYVFTGMYLGGASRSLYLTLLSAPLYIPWKLWLYLTSLFGYTDRGWIRTARVAALASTLVRASERS